MDKVEERKVYYQSLSWLQEFKERLKKEFPDFKRIYLFGSRAKGNFNEESDYDILALFKETNRSKKLRIYRIIGELEYTFDVFIDIHILTESEFRFNPFFHEEVVKFGFSYE